MDISHCGSRYPSRCIFCYWAKNVVEMMQVSMNHSEQILHNGSSLMLQGCFVVSEINLPRHYLCKIYIIILVYFLLHMHFIFIFDTDSYRIFWFLCKNCLCLNLLERMVKPFFISGENKIADILLIFFVSRHVGFKARVSRWSVFWLLFFN